MHTDAPPRPHLLLATAEQMSSILFMPELIAPPPIIWLPSDNAGVARAKARDLSAQLLHVHRPRPGMHPFPQPLQARNIRIRKEMQLSVFEFYASYWVSDSDYPNFY
jgi:Extracellular tail, of 10TM putative phosphate transporter